MERVLAEYSTLEAFGFNEVVIVDDCDFDSAVAIARDYLHQIRDSSTLETPNLGGFPVQTICDYTVVLARSNKDSEEAIQETFGNRVNSGLVLHRFLVDESVI